jgi:hypothetical protein
VAKNILKSFFIKLFQWEYWNSNIINAPIFFYWLYLSVRAKSLFFFNASNPLIENGGFVLEKKSDIYKQMPPAFYPKTLLVNKGENRQSIKECIIAFNFNFPVIVKPDIGGKGRGVKKINSIDEAVAYILYADFPMLVQELVPYKYEVGIFYYRYPWQAKGQITGIVGKEFISVIGDGVSNVETLLCKNPRFLLQIDALKKMPEVNLEEILPIGVEKVLVAFGNHARGSKFVDLTHKVNKTLDITIDAICKQIPEFYFGRLDVMYNNWEDLETGKDFSIIELNGSGSEPTHIYDGEKHSIFFAWKEIAKHQKIMWQIAMYNHKQKGIPFIAHKTGMKMLKDLKAIEAKLDLLT